MAYTEHYYTKFDSGNFYHVYNRSVDRKPMFITANNFRFFLKQYEHYLSEVVDTYAYCLLHNHFHFLIKVRDLTTFEKLSNLNPANPDSSETNGKGIHQIVSHQFRKFFQAYAMAFNKQEARIGTLFQTPFKRVLVDNDQYFTQLVYYIHANPQAHGLIKDFRDWKWSSYSSMLTDKPTKIRKEEVLSWFGGLNRYRGYHSTYQNIISKEKYFLNED